jgi:hypothetical protein
LTEYEKEAIKYNEELREKSKVYFWLVMRDKVNECTLMFVSIYLKVNNVKSNKEDRIKYKLFSFKQN